MDAREFGGTLAWRTRAHEALGTSRRRLLELLGRVPTGVLAAQHSPLMSPPVWDVAHVANYEEQWLLRALGEPGLTGPETDRLYDAFRNPRDTRGALPLLGLEEALAYAEQVRARVLRRLDALDDETVARVGPLLDGGYVYGMVAQHEQQHIETLVATLQLVTSTALDPLPSEASSPNRAVLPREVLVRGGPFEMGSDEAWAYDNERPRYQVNVPAFLIDRFPVTSGQFLAFMEDGGYANRRHWTDAGWAFRAGEQLEHPLFWRRSGEGWERRRFGTWEPLRLDEPVCHVCWYEADAYARWAGGRLPTEVEWEKAAAGTPEGKTRRFPWGDAPPDVTRANLWPAGGHPARVGAFPTGASAWGVEQLLGDVWEWTASDFQPYPGFRAFPYPEYSAVFFGAEYKVLRGGSWAVAPDAIRNTFRNWDYPIRRQIFAGFRCARDA
ncbi:MAG TPA: ergothioneine biosynthesis protein EgtB [Myxococcaceae bacterium]|nr:ergothioneine biosynthesis protein EgtB [Myxococcaceae bacterium]